jgi:hypothetical protein
MELPVGAAPCTGAPVMELPVGAAPCCLKPPLASFFGFRSRTLMFFFFDFDILAFLFWVVYCFCCLNCVSDAEQKLTAAGNVLFWNQIIEADQFFLSASWPGMRWIPGCRVFFVFRCTHFERLLPAFMPTQYSGDSVARVLSHHKRLTHRRFGNRVKSIAVAAATFQGQSGLTLSHA